MPENRLLSESDLWFSPSQMKEGAKNALLYPFRNPEQTAEFGLSMAPGSGEAMSARDAWDASGRAGNALLSGNYGQAASEYGNVATGLLGALPGAGIIARGTKRGAAWMDRNLPTGVNKLLDAVTPQASQDTLYAIPAWHGSPHDFDQFKLDKIGTGEGAQAYGHGLYMAESPAVAETYRTAGAAGKVPSKSGKLYHTELDVEPEDLLDWDKPLSQQSEKVQAAVRKLSDANPNQFRKDEINRWFQSDGDFFSGSRLYDVLQSDFGGREELTRALRKAGIPGIRYLDQGSRGAGQGSSNYVIFDDSLVKILGKE